MINLLPPETKKQIRAARTNVVLVNYCLLIGFTALLLGAVYGVGFWADMNDRQVAETTKAETQNEATAYADTRAQAENFAADLGVARTILASNVSFSTLILYIASVVPPDVILNSLSLGTTANNAPIDINGRAKSYEAAISLKNSLEASIIFENVNIVSINRVDLSTIPNPEPEVLNYPFVISLKAQFSKGETNAEAQP